MKKKLLSMVTVLFLALVIVFTSTSNAYAAGLSSSQKSKIKSLVSNTLPLTMCTNISRKHQIARKSYMGCMEKPQLKTFLELA